MKFTTTILDRYGNEWNAQCEVEGKGMYDDDGNKSFMVIEDFRLTNIVCLRNEALFAASSSAVMHDIFNEREIRELEKEAEGAFFEDWTNIQDCASDASYETFVSQNLA